MMFDLTHAQEVALDLMTSPAYRRSIEQRLAAGTLPTEIEVLLLVLALGDTGSIATELDAIRRFEADLLRREKPSRPVLAFRSPLSDDEIEARRIEAALDGDVERVAALNREHGRKP